MSDSAMTGPLHGEVHHGCWTELTDIPFFFVPLLLFLSSPPADVRIMKQSKPWKRLFKRRFFLGPIRMSLSATEICHVTRWLAPDWPVRTFDSETWTVIGRIKCTVLTVFLFFWFGEDLTMSPVEVHCCYSFRTEPTCKMLKPFKTMFTR